MDDVTPVVLAVGTTHPLNIAGVGLDARVAALLGVRIVTVVAGVSAQSAHTVLARLPVDDATIGAQFEALGAVAIGAVHIGALLDAGSVRAVATGVAALPGVPLVCDPVIAASTGGRLADDATVRALHGELFARCTLVTPNIGEAALLVGRRLDDVGAVETSARELHAAYGAAILIKGGHLAGEPVDVLASSDGVVRFAAERIPATLRGTGDLLAAAIAARLAYGDDVVAAITAARTFVRRCLTAGVPFAGARTVP